MFIIAQDLWYYECTHCLVGILQASRRSVPHPNPHPNPEETLRFQGKEGKLLVSSDLI